jgi:hypothetical protein
MLRYGSRCLLQEHVPFAAKVRQIVSTYREYSQPLLAHCQFMRWIAAPAHYEGDNVL